MKDLMKYVVIFSVTSYMILNTVAMTTNNRVLLSGVLVGSAVAASYYGDYNFSPLEIAALTTALLVLNFPRRMQKAEEPKCTAPGYKDDPLLGRYQLIQDAPLSHTDASKYCAKDGGRLLLINSEAEAKALQAVLREGDISLAAVQGSRTSVSSPWVTDNGNPLPYTGPKGAVFQNNPNFKALVFNIYFEIRASQNNNKIPFLVKFHEK